MEVIITEGYTTVAARAAAEFVEKKSRFIGTAAPVTTEEQALDFISGVRAENREARHNVYAYILRQGQLSRFSDDGEPQGTGGRPVLELLQKQELTDVAVVVTRYFGGILLGTGGLTRAYGQGAKLAVAAAKVQKMLPAVRVELDIGYDLYGQLTYILPDYGAMVESSDFAQGIRLVLRMEECLLDAFCTRLRELSAGTASPIVRERFFAPFE